MQRFDSLWSALMFDASPEEQLRSARLLWRGGMLAFVIWALGTLSPFGLAGFARADAVDEKIKAAVDPLLADNVVIKEELRAAKRESLQTRIWLLGNEVFKARQEQCSAIKAGQGARFWTERLLELKSEYEALASKQYDVPDCSEL